MYLGNRAGTAGVELIDKVDVAPGSGSSFYGERTTREYDFGGNVDWALKERSGDIDGTGMVGTVQHVQSRSYYSAEDRLRYFQENDVSIENQIPTHRGVWEEYRYDALGRRVMTDTRRRGLCDQDSWVCASATTRFVWSGDQLLWELKTPSASPQEVAGHNDTYGTVGYFHAGGIDRPLVITKGSTSIIPHQNWRGQFSRGTYSNGQPSDCAPNRTPCTNVAWPGYRTTAWHMESKEPNIRNWFGGLVDGMRDASGQMYMRNRYYDPATGQFTQPDPIGLAGGMNSYGFAAGDPVSYADPYGLSAQGRPPLCPVGGPAPGLAPGISEGMGRLAGFGRAALGVLGSVATRALGVASVLTMESSVSFGMQSVLVTHFTSEAGAAAIEGSALAPGSYVTLSSTAGMSASEVEAFLEIDPDKGTMSATFLMFNRDLLPAPDGPVTSGGATQMITAKPITLPPGSFKPTPQE